MRFAPDRLSTALDAHGNQQAADIVRLCLLTGARSGEVMSATWDQFDLDAATWVKPSSHTKQKREHRVPLSAPALQLLIGFPHREGFLFPSHGKDASLVLGTHPPSGPASDIPRRFAVGRPVPPR